MKKWWTSKTLWVNLIAVVAMIAQGVTGKNILPLEAQGTAIGVINLILRTITNSSVTWK